MTCRNCFGTNRTSFLNLFAQPLSNSLITKEKKLAAELYFPLEVFVCPDCYFVQIDDHGQPEEIFNEDYTYYSSTSPEFVEHACVYVDHMTELLGLSDNSFVVEAASNDGYLLQHFLKKGIPHLGVEPTGCAQTAQSIGVNTLNDFFTSQSAQQIVDKSGHADLFLGNNVLAHVPDLNDFVKGISILLKKNGVATLEFPHLLNMMKETQFDTVYHEHYSYISYLAVRKTFERHGLEIFRIDKLLVHGGSLRLYVAPIEAKQAIEDSVLATEKEEVEGGLDKVSTYEDFQTKTDQVCSDFVQFLLKEKAAGKTIWGFGAAAKGNTFLNYCGVKANLIEAIVDDTPRKQGRLAPGSRIPIVTQDELKTAKPDYIVILPWNWKDAIKDKLSYAKEWHAKFVTAIPNMEIVAA